MSNWKRSTTNVVATMLIFAIMITSMGVLYSLISPTLFGFEADTKSANQEFVFLTVANTMQELISSADGSQGRVHIVSNQAIYSVNSGQNIQINVSDDDGLTGGISSPVSIGAFYSNVSGVFEPLSNPIYLNERADETSFMSGNNTGFSPSYVSKAQYSRDSADFTLYFKVRLDLIEITSNNYVLTVTIIKIDFNEFNNKPTDFPIERDEWTLRLRREAAIVTSSANQTITGNITISDGITSLLPIDLDGKNIIIKFIEIPIKFGI